MLFRSPICYDFIDGFSLPIPLWVSRCGVPIGNSQLATIPSESFKIGRASCRERVMVQLAYYQQKLKQGYDANVRLRPLAPGDLVLRKVLGTAKNPAWGKIGPNWEGSYHITSVAGIGAYFLEDLDEHVVPRP